MATGRGRRRIELDKKEFESLLGLQCSLREIAAFFDSRLDSGCSEDTVERWCKRTYKRSFREVAEEKREIGKISIRRMQFRLAEKSPAMAIWLGKQHLGQQDHQPRNFIRKDQKDALSIAAEMLMSGDSSIIVDGDSGGDSNAETDE